MNLWDMHAYVLTWRNGEPLPFYERTFPAACLTEAQRWIVKSGKRGFICINCLPRDYWR